MILRKINVPQTTILYACKALGMKNKNSLASAMQTKSIVCKQFFESKMQKRRINKMVKVVYRGMAFSILIHRRQPIQRLIVM